MTATREVFVWQESGRLAEFVVDNVDQYKSLLRKIIPTLCDCNEHWLTEDVIYFLTTDAANSIAACYAMLNRIVDYVGYYPDIVDGFQIFTFR